MGVSGAAARFTIRASLFEWENLEQAHRYMSSEELRRKMKEAGVASAPEIEYLGEMYTVRRSAAD